MPTPKKGPRLGGGPAHERLLLANLATALFEHDSITTTEAKAKRMRPLAERLITFAKRGDLAARRRVMTVVRDKSVVHRLFVEIAPDMAERPGGYTRITKVAPRKGDNAPMAVIELIREPYSPKQATVREAEGATRRAAKEQAAAPAAPAQDSAAPVADEAPVTEAPVADAPVADAAPAAGEAEFAGSAAPQADGTQPAGFDIKGNRDSMIYHVPGSRSYDATVAEVWFDSVESAEAAGFRAPRSAGSQDDDQA